MKNEKYVRDRTEKERGKMEGRRKREEDSKMKKEKERIS